MMDVELKRKKGFQSIIAYLLVFYVGATIISLIVAAIFSNTGIDLKTDRNALISANAWINFLTYIVLFISLVFINHKALSDEFNSLRSSNGAIKKVLGALGISYVISYFFSLLISNIEININFNYELFGIYNFIETTSENQSSIETILHSNSMILMFLSAAIFGPLCEELVFRKAIFSVVKMPEIALLVSSALFGFIHITSSFGSSSFLEIFLMFSSYLASGIAFGYVYMKNNYNIWIPTLAHMIMNTVSMIAILL